MLIVGRGATRDYLSDGLTRMGWDCRDQMGDGTAIVSAFLPERKEESRSHDRARDLYGGLEIKAHNEHELVDRRRGCVVGLIRTLADDGTNVGLSSKVCIWTTTVYKSMKY